MAIFKHAAMASERVRCSYPYRQGAPSPGTARQRRPARVAANQEGGVPAESRPTRRDGNTGMNGTRALEEKVVVVTGAGRGIGREIALLAARECA